MDLSTWLAFFAASWAISLSPGAGAIAAMSAGLNHGLRHGWPIVFGLVAGIWTQIVVVGIGLGALIAASSLAFLVVKWAGVAYLVWLGVQQWRAPAVPVVAATADAPSVSGRDQYAVIAGTLALTDTVVMAGYMLLAARVLRLLRAPSHLKAMNRVFGALFVLAGSLLATFKKV
jgi:homoserine/homoserine lactone efflux protein